MVVETGSSNIDVAWQNGDHPRLADVPVTAAKLHILQLAPIKARLGEKWVRLSHLVHKLFEQALTRAQGPADHFILFDELSYIVTFKGLTFDQANLACTAIAQEVCERLFGEHVGEISVRALVGTVSVNAFQGDFHDGKHIATMLELNGRETIVTSSAPSGGRQLATAQTPGSMDADWKPLNLIKRAQVAIEATGLDMGLFPLWDMQKNKCTGLFLSPYSIINGAAVTSGRSLLSRLDERHICDIEIALLYAANAYALRVNNEHKICALGVGVSYETLSGFNSRIRYIGALKSVPTLASCPLLLKIEQVPEGAPIARLAEIIAMLSVPNVRITVQFQSASAISKIDIRLGASGIGGMLPNGCDCEAATSIAQQLVRRSTEQKTFSFLDGLESDSHVHAAYSHGIRFGTGVGFGIKGPYPIAGIVPDFPLMLPPA
jgi:hypothetical protein